MAEQTRYTAETAQWIRRITRKYDLSDSERELLYSAGQLLDRAAQAREQVATDGAFVSNRFGEMKEHAGLLTERKSLELFARLVRQLKINDADIGAVDLPEEGAGVCHG